MTVCLSLGRNLRRQQHDRDTFGMAIKCSHAIVNGKGRDVYKSPITSPSKLSKKGMVAAARDRQTGEILTVDLLNYNQEKYEILTRPVYRDGQILIEDSFDDIRQRSRS